MNFLKESEDKNITRETKNNKYYQVILAFFGVPLNYQRGFKSRYCLLYFCMCYNSPVVGKLHYDKSIFFVGTGHDLFLHVFSFTGMALNYSLKYKKLNFYNKVLLEKEGEVIIDRHSFRLKGKGARDHGETIYFGDIHEISLAGRSVAQALTIKCPEGSHLNEDEVIFTTFKKERYRLSNFSSLFSSFVKDFFRIRNEYLAEHLNMKVGMLYKEYDGQVEIIDGSGEINNKGMARIQFYEGSMVIFPEARECCVVYFQFMRSHEFDEEEYLLKLYLENEFTVQISKLRTHFKDARETFEMLLSKMYERIVNNLKNILPEFQSVELLKLAYLIRDGKLVNFNAIKKINEDLQKKVEELIFQNNQLMYQKARTLLNIDPNSQLHIGLLSLNKSETHETIKSWFLCVLPASNTIAIGLCLNQRDVNIYFFRISFEEANLPVETQNFASLQAQKIFDFNQSMFSLKYDIEPLYKEKHQLLKSRFRLLFRKLPFLRHCRTSYLGKSAASDLSFFQKEIEQFCRRAMTYYKNPKS